MSGTNGTRPRTADSQMSEEFAALLENGLEQIKNSWTLPGRLIAEPEAWPIEQDRIFGRSWVFLGHESEIPDAGDYVVRYITQNQFVVCRDEDGTVRAFQNSCRHRGMQICRAEVGNTSHFRCPYHGWTYSNKGNLVGVPAGREAYGNKLDKKDWSLNAIPGLGVYKGLIFGTVNPDAESLDDYLGDFKFYLDIMVGRSKNGLEVIGVPQRWIVDTNWKLASDNFVGDAYHTMWTHRSGAELGYTAPDPAFGIHGEHVHTPGGHGLGMISPSAAAPVPGFQGVPENIIDEARTTLTAEQFKISEQASFIHGTVFPNFSFLSAMGGPDHKSPPVSYLTFRIWHPLGPDKTEIWSFFMVDKDAPAEYREMSQTAYIRHFGAAGVIEQDDAENWRSINNALRGNMGRENVLNYQMGRDHIEPDANWPGPGIAYPLDYAEANQRNFWESYLTQMSTPSTSAAKYTATAPQAKV
ncbi:MAG: aromatic ring-hydroxylating dioxygenase subunit alpha [Rhodococcus sp. (in: high G+C Gram-positive bacteria)]|uniref:aromatic ring-hydroxylating dioxygenase subunit alpha n=1 Tax=Rhodococcus sp. TaxID=1831 RepID=UPI002AD7735F|nr:aromatic ring-hydroxylating dioxygenase subunit alpha [Rhodococcus sp. (in: high G+C Gram-positive bacteria)]